MSFRAASLMLLLPLAGCGHAVGSARATTGLAMPSSSTARRAALEDLGRRAWAAMVEGRPTHLLIHDAALPRLLDRQGVRRIAARRLALADRLAITPVRLSRPLASATYAGICLQGARSVDVGSPPGLAQEGWVFDRLLIIGRLSSGQRVAAWIEGIFIYTDVGFGAIDLERVERPRWEHSDLEIAPCDLAVRRDLPEIAR